MLLPSSPLPRLPGLVRAGLATAAVATMLILTGCETRSVEQPAQETPATTSVAEAPAGVEPTPPREPRVGLLVPLSGPHAALGTAMLQAAEMALFDVGDERFVLLPRDTGGTPAGSAQAASEVIEQGAALILGPLFSASASAVRPVASAAGVNVITFSTDPGVAGGGIYVFGLLSRDQVRRAVEYAAANGLYRFGVLVPSTPYGQQVAADAGAAAAAVGGAVTRTAYYDPASPDKSEAVRGFVAGAVEGGTREEQPFDAVLLPAGGDELVSVAPLLPYFDIETEVVQLLGSGQWDGGNLGREPSLVGGWYAAPDPAGRASFEQRYAAIYGREAPRLATLAYDATALAAVLASESVPPDFGAARLTASDGFSGLDGLFRFLPDGLSERRLAVMEVTPQGSRVIGPAATSFVPLTE